MTEQLAGADLARSLLNAHKAAARANGTMPTAAGKPPVTGTRRRHRGGTGRDPMSLADIVETLTGGKTSTGSGLAGGRIIAEWPSLCPPLFAGHVEPTHYDPTRGRLDLRPGSHAYAAQLRLLSGSLANQINAKLGTEAVKTIRVLTPGDLTTAVRTPAASELAAEALPPVKTRDMASPGYRNALAAALANRPERKLLPGVREAEERQDAALRAHREPEDVHAARVALWAEDRPELPEPGSVEASHRAALARKRREQAGLAESRRAFDAA